MASLETIIAQLGARTVLERERAATRLQELLAGAFSSVPKIGSYLPEGTTASTKSRTDVRICLELLYRVVDVEYPRQGYVNLG